MSVSEIILPSGILTNVNGRCIQRGTATLSAGVPTVVPCVGFDGATMIVQLSVLVPPGGTPGELQTLASNFTAGTSFAISSTSATQTGPVYYQVWESSAKVVNAP